MNCGLTNHWSCYNVDLECSGWSGALSLEGWNTFRQHRWRWALWTRMVIFPLYGYSKYCHLWRAYRCIQSWNRLCLYQIWYHHNYTIVIGKVWLPVGWTELLVGCLGVSVLMVDLYGATKKIWATSGFGLKVIIVRSLGVSGTCILDLYFRTWYKID